MKKPYVVLTTAVSALALAGVVGVGIASADPTASPTPSSSPSASSTPAATPSSPAAKPAKPGKADKKKKDLTGRALHGEVTLGGKKKTRVVDFQRGTVSAVSSDKLTVRSVDGFEGTYVIGSKTRVVVEKQKSTIGEVATGDRVRVVAVKDGQTLTATRVVEHKKK